MSFTLQILVILGLSSGLWLGADTKCPKAGDCCMTCPEGWIEMDSRCFLYRSTKMSWCEAERACIAAGGNLASFHDPIELLTIRDLLGNLAGGKPAWLGGTDAVREGVWMWSDGSKLDYTEWAHNEPNNGGGRQHCMLIRGDAKLIKDAKCSRPKPFICSTDLERKE